MTDSPDVPASREAQPPRPGLLVAAVVIAALEALAITAYSVVIAVAAFQTPDSVSAGPVVVVLFLLFAVGIALAARGLWQRRAAARTPFGVTQMFGLVTGWTLTQGDGTATHVAGYAVLVVSLVGIALVLAPSVGEALE